MTKKLFAAAGLLLTGALMLASVACAAGGEKEPTPVTTWKITPASGTRSPTATAGTPTAVVGSPTAAVTPGVTPGVTGTPAGGTTLTIIAQNIVFDKTTLTAPAGAVTVVLENKDGGVPHNIHFFKGSDATGESVGMTPITTGPVTDKVTLTFAPGEYFYQCDVHPTTMTGKLTVT